VNITATVFLPAQDLSTMTEGGKPASVSVGVKFLNFEHGVAAFRVDSGTYSFESILTNNAGDSHK
jgi:alpha-L-rhamnosidase